VLSHTFGYSVTVSPFSQEAQSAFEAIKKLPEVVQLINDAERDGPIRLEMRDLGSNNFEAFWDSTNRVIRVNSVTNKSFGNLIASVLFELHNASSDRYFKQLYSSANHGHIDKNGYVESVEKMEHQNALNTSMLLDKGIRLGVFPKDSRWPIFRSFEDHYKVQQLTEHSQWIASNYDKVFRNRGFGVFHGSIPGIARMSPEDKRDMIRYLGIKNDLESPVDRQSSHGAARLYAEQQALAKCYTGKSQNCSRTKEKVALLEQVFKGNTTFEMIKKTFPAYTVSR